MLIECSGQGSSVNRLFDYGRRGAQFIQLGTSMHRYEIDFMQIAYKELKVVGVSATTIATGSAACN